MCVATNFADKDSFNELLQGVAYKPFTPLLVSCGREIDLVPPREIVGY